jgi:hypothetical protein
MLGSIGAAEVQVDLHLLRVLHVLLGFLLTRKLAASGQWLLKYTNSKHRFEFSRRRERVNENG